MGKLAFVFPGQGSQKVGMGKDLYSNSPEVHDFFDGVDRRLGEGLSTVCFSGPAELLGQTVYTQPAVLAVSLAFLKPLMDAGLEPDFVAGHSLGEYSALAAAGSLDMVDAAWLVRRRGLYMEEAVPDRKGAMAAVLGLDQSKTEECCRAASADGTVVVANLNSPGQIVISGWRPAVERAGELCKQAGAKRVMPLEVSGPFHSPLMSPAVARLEESIDQLEWKDPGVPVIANCLARPVTTVTQVRDALLSQMTSPVRWQESVEYMVAEGVDTFVEVGPGKVLSGLIKRIAGGVKVYNVGDMDSLEKVLASLKGGG